MESDWVMQKIGIRHTHNNITGQHNEVTKYYTIIDVQGQQRKESRL
jgi:hypothetical protein